MDEFRTPDGNIINPYGVLKVDRDATRTVIRQAYRKLSKKYHPDAVRHNTVMPGSCDNLEQVREEWDRIQFSHDILSDKKLRQKYDRQSALINDDPGSSLDGATLETVSWGFNRKARGKVDIDNEVTRQYQYQDEGDGFMWDNISNYNRESVRFNNLHDDLSRYKRVKLRHDPDVNYYKSVQTQNVPVRNQHEHLQNDRLNGEFQNHHEPVQNVNHSSDRSNGEFQNQHEPVQNEYHPSDSLNKDYETQYNEFQTQNQKGEVQNQHEPVQNEYHPSDSLNKDYETQYNEFQTQNQKGEVQNQHEPVQNEYHPSDSLNGDYETQYNEFQTQNQNGEVQNQIGPIQNPNEHDTTQLGYVSDSRDYPFESNDQSPNQTTTTGSSSSESKDFVQERFEQSPNDTTRSSSPGVDWFKKTNKEKLKSYSKDGGMKWSSEVGLASPFSRSSDNSGVIWHSGQDIHFEDW